jgi:hypothetical protein
MYASKDEVKRVNQFEQDLIQSFDFENAFNRNMMYPLGHKFIESFYCIPTFIIHHKKISIRNILHQSSVETIHNVTH